MEKTEFLRETIDLVRSIETRFLELGGRLWKIKEDKLWTSVFESYEEFLESAHITPSMSSILTRVYGVYVLGAGIDVKELYGIGYSNLYEAIPLLKDNDAATVIQMAKTLTRNEIKQNVREENFGECKHAEIICICASCKKRLMEFKPMMA